MRIMMSFLATLLIGIGVGVGALFAMHAYVPWGILGALAVFIAIAGPCVIGSALITIALRIEKRLNPQAAGEDRLTAKQRIIKMIW